MKNAGVFWWELSTVPVSIFFDEKVFEINAVFSGLLKALNTGTTGARSVVHLLAYKKRDT